ncbi:MAG: membrane protein insertase YidC, partial [Prevotellaceae bacterium]|nr:membrane protein insertase YidC [Prevotellaceae bacterium]
EGEERFYTVENEKLRVKFTNKGGRISSVELKEYKSYDDFKSGTDKPLELFAGDDGNFSLTFFSKSQDITTSSFYFEPPTSISTETLVSADSILVPFRLYADSASYLEFLYTIYKDDYKIGLNINFVNMKNHVGTQTAAVDLDWRISFRQKEKGFANENNYTGIAYKYPGETSIEQMSASASEESEKVPSKLEWINFKQHFFSAILLTGGSTNNEMNFVSYNEDNPDKLLKTCEARLQLAYDSETTQNIPIEFYFVPNHFRTLKAYDRSFEKIITLGGWIIGWINRGIVIPVFNFLGDYAGITSFGLIIFILTLLIKIIISPLTWKSYLSSAKMKVLKPEVDKIGEKYPDKKDALKKQQEVMALYKRTGVNMLGGCLPALLQMPVFIALFRFFPASIELRQESFLWADDLSSFDSVWNLPFSIPLYGNHISLFTLLMALALFASTKINMSQQNAATPQMKQMNAMMLYVMPLMMILWFNGYSSGLTYYYFLSNVITIIQTMIIRKYFVDEAALLKKLNERAAKQQTVKRKKESFSERLLKKQQELQRQQQARDKQKKSQNKKR